MSLQKGALKSLYGMSGKDDVLCEEIGVSTFGEGKEQAAPSLILCYCAHCELYFPEGVVRNLESII